MSDLTALGILVLLLAGNGFFVASEFAMVSARRDHLEPAAAEGSKRARWSLRGLENVSVSLAATQLGITACSLLIGAVGEPALAHLIEKPVEALGIPEGFVHPIALVIALLIVTFLHMVLGEMVPKNMAIARPAAAALLLGPVLRVFVLVFKPVIWLMNHSANLVVKYVCRVEPRDEVETTFTVDQMRGMVATSGDEGLLDEDEATLLAGALAFDDIPAAAVATPLADMDWVEEGCPAGLVHELCVTTGHSRFPVRAAAGSTSRGVAGTDYIGYVHVKDTLGDDPTAPLRPERIRELGTVTPGTALDDVLERMQSARAHLALVVVEGSGVEGLVAMEDLLERLVGEVRGITPEAV